MLHIFIHILRFSAFGNIDTDPYIYLFM